MKLSQHIPSATKRVLISGLSGSGKSTLAAQMAEEGWNLHWFNLENATDTLLKLSPAAQDRINLINIPDSASYPIAAQTLLLLFKNNKAVICDAHGKHACPICAKTDDAVTTTIDFNSLTTKDIVVIDTGTQLSYSILAYISKDKPVDYKPERDDWGALRKYTEFFKSQFQGARFNLIVTCQCQEAELENGTKKLVPSFGSGAMSANFASAFDHVIYTDVVNKKHRAYSSSTASSAFLTRSRSDFVIEAQEKLTLLPIFQQAHTEKELPTQNISLATITQIVSTPTTATITTAIPVSSETIAAPNPMHQDTPATKAISGLAGLKSRLGNFK